MVHRVRSSPNLAACTDSSTCRRARTGSRPRCRDSVTFIREGIVVAVGQSVQLPLTLGVATVQEAVTVTGDSPVIDTKAMGTATNFTQDELSRVPNSRDPWALLRTVPGVTLDRVNIAGNETGQQSAFVSKGGRQGDAVWTMDGVPITDMATNGALADLLRLRRVRRDPDLDRRQRHPAGDRRRRPELRRQARHEPVARHGARLFHRRRPRSDQRARRARRARRDAARPPTTTSRSPTSASTPAARSSRTSCSSGARSASRTSVCTGSRRAAPIARCSRPTTPRSTGRRRRRTWSTSCSSTATRSRMAARPGNALIEPTSAR